MMNPGYPSPRSPLFRRLPALLSGVLAASILAACGGESTDRVPMGQTQTPSTEAVAELPPELQSQLDSANAAYRAGDYERALVVFTEVTDEAPDLAAGWYGVGMTHGALGNAEAADSAMMQVHELAPDLPLMHPGGEAPTNPHPNPVPPTGDSTGSDASR